MPANLSTRFTLRPVVVAQKARRIFSTTQFHTLEVVSVPPKDRQHSTTSPFVPVASRPNCGMKTILQVPETLHCSSPRTLTVCKPAFRIPGSQPKRPLPKYEIG